MGDINESNGNAQEESGPSDSNDDIEAAEERTSAAQGDEDEPPLHLLLDAGYGIPREARPRQEKILAIAKQIANFLEWQVQGKETPAPVTVVGCDAPGMKEALLERLKKLWAQQQQPPKAEEESNNKPTDLPSHFSFAEDSDHSTKLMQNAVYLSPDAPSALNPSQPPPGRVIVGLLIDRRVQLNRSLNRSDQLRLPAQRWPMEAVAEYHHPQEPLNVDTILEALQQWSWNSARGEAVQDETPFVRASMDAFGRHAQRHPARPKHRPS